ncbi:MAG: diaminopimelate epimerase [Alphaproteobacteria bacterium]
MAAQKTPFLKMHGTGNDFVVLDGRKRAVSIDSASAKRIADRHFGIGCDQLVVLGESKKADVFMRIFNSDGSEISTCGNASRCVADLLMREGNVAQATIETAAGLLVGMRAEGDSVTIDMGEPKWEWRDVPLSESRNTLHLGIAEGLLMDPVAISMGNPHAIFFVRDLHHIRLGEWGPKLEHDRLFPQRANISAVQVVSPEYIKMAVWERGTGLTLACGSAACAAVVAGVRREILERKVEVDLPGGRLSVEWRPGEGNGRVLMTGPVAYVFNGEIEL